MVTFMEAISIAAKIIIAAGIVNVWIFRFNKPTAYRGGSATSMKEEFAAYGLSEGVMKLIGFLKLLLAALLVIGIWVAPLAAPAAAGMAVLMIGAIAMHFKVGDPAMKSLPAFLMLLLSLVVLFF
jgi:hypothetical protein